MKSIEILLVEDNVGDARLVQEAIKESKLYNNLHHVIDGEQALDFLYQRNGFEDRPRPDLMLLDLNMPKLDGRQVLAKVKQDDMLRQIPVVVLTTSSSDEDIIRSYDLHANCYITKPVDFEQFIKVVQSINKFWFSIVKLPKQ
jgi:two-component system response regulator